MLAPLKYQPKVDCNLSNDSVYKLFLKGGSVY